MGSEPSTARGAVHALNYVKDLITGDWVEETQPGGSGGGGTSSTFGAAFPATGTAVGAKDSTGVNMVPLNLDAAGLLKVNVAAGGAGGGACTIADGADVAEGATADAAVITDAAGTISGKLRGLIKWAFERMPASLGQKLMALSFPVTIASDQSSIPVTTTPPSVLLSTTLSADGRTSLDVRGIGSIAIWGPQTVAFGGSLALNGSTDNGATWFAVYTVRQDDSTIISSITAANTGRVVRVNVSGLTTFSLLLTGFVAPNIPLVIYGDAPSYTDKTSAVIIDPVNSNALLIDGFGAAKMTMRSDTGTILGIATSPVRVDPTGTTIQPVSAASLPLPTGASTEATLALIKAKTDNLDVLLSTRTKPADSQHVTVDNGSIAVTGPLTDAQLRASAVPVSGTVAVSNMIPAVETGLAKDATLVTIDTDLKATQPRDVTDRAARLLGHVTVDSAPTTPVTVASGAAVDLATLLALHQTQILATLQDIRMELRIHSALLMDGLNIKDSNVDTYRNDPYYFN